ncbi:hypothetical protein AAFN85_25625 [Mucilaginibacter sp. CAU 1740]|uniref:NHL domain-containing protein n=1 Tax=Mucilaginibacter sp. CAU 1740 TaxID=3140365 RepID=UPI00325A7B95
MSCKTERVEPVITGTPDVDKSAAANAAPIVYPQFTVRTIAGIFEQQNSEPHLVNGPGPKAKFWKPHGISVAIDGSIYIADFFNGAIRKISVTNEVTTIAIPKTYLLLPEAVEVGNDGTFYIVSTGYGVRIYNKNGIDLNSRIGNADSNLDIEKDDKGGLWFVNSNSLCKITGVDIQRNVVNFSSLLSTGETLRAIATGPNGVKYVSSATQLFKVAADGKITKLFTDTNFTFISGIDVTKDGSTLYIVDGNTIKKIYQNKISVIAKPTSGDGKDGIGLSADIVGANLALSNSETALFVTDTRNTIRKIQL